MNNDTEIPETLKRMPICFVISTEQLKWLTAQAVAQDRSKSAVIRLLIEAAMKDGQNGK